MILFLIFPDTPYALPEYDGRTVKFKGLVARDRALGGKALIVGRHVMTCCADDITFSGVVCNFKNEIPYETGAWITVTAKIRVEAHRLYGQKGPVLYAVDSARTAEPAQPVATFY